MNNFVGLGTISIDIVVMLIGSIVGLWDLTIVDCRSCHLMVVRSLDIGVSDVGQGRSVVDNRSMCVSHVVDRMLRIVLFDMVKRVMLVLVVFEFAHPTVSVLVVRSMVRLVKRVSLDISWTFRLGWLDDWSWSSRSRSSGRLRGWSRCGLSWFC